jgi:hypothetical protein
MEKLPDYRGGIICYVSGCAAECIRDPDILGVDPICFGDKWLFSKLTVKTANVEVGKKYLTIDLRTFRMEAGKTFKHGRHPVVMVRRSLLFATNSGIAGIIKDPAIHRLVFYDSSRFYCSAFD